MCLAPFAVSDVASDFRCAIFSLPNGFKVFDALAAPDSLYDRFLLFLVIGWNQNRNRLADDFLGHVAKNTLRSGIPTRYDAILGHDRVVAWMLRLVRGIG